MVEFRARREEQAAAQLRGGGEGVEGAELGHRGLHAELGQEHQLGLDQALSGDDAVLLGGEQSGVVLERDGQGRVQVEGALQGAGVDGRRRGLHRRRRRRGRGRPGLSGPEGQRRRQDGRGHGSRP